jgi:hypothetical protein
MHRLDIAALPAAQADPQGAHECQMLSGALGIGATLRLGDVLDDPRLESHG